MPAADPRLRESLTAVNLKLDELAHNQDLINNKIDKLAVAHVEAQTVVNAKLSNVEASLKIQEAQMRTELSEHRRALELQTKDSEIKTLRAEAQTRQDALVAQNKVDVTVAGIKVKTAALWSFLVLGIASLGSILVKLVFFGKL